LPCLATLTSPVWLGRVARIDGHARRVQQVDLKDRLGELGRARHQLAAQVAVELAVRVEVERLLGELGEEAELGDRAGALETGEADAVDAPALLAERRQPARALLGGDRLDDGDALGAHGHEAVVPLDRAEARLAVGIIPVGRGLARLLGDDLELRRLAIGLEADGGEGAIADNQHREDVVVVARLPVARVGDNRGADARPALHLGNHHDPEKLANLNPNYPSAST
jgi:hypothetical protein